MRIVRDRPTITAYLFLGFFMLSRSILAPFITYRSAENAGETSRLGAHIAVSAVGIMLMGLVWSRVGTYFSRKKTTIVCSVLLAVGVVGLYVSVIPVSLIAAFILGAAGSGVNISMQGFLSDRHGQVKKIALGEAAVSSSIFGAAAPLVLAFSQDVMGIGWRGGLLVSPIVLVVLLMLSRPIEFAEVPARTEVLAEKTDKGRVSAVLWCWILTLVLCSATEWTVLYWGPSFLHHIGSVPLSLSVSVVSAMIGFQIIGRLLWTRLSRWFTVNQLLFACILVALVGLMSLYGLVLFIADFGPVLLSVLVFSIGISGTSQLITVKVVEGCGNSGRGLSYVSFAAGLSVLLFPWLLGSQAQYVGLRAAFLIPLVCAVAALIMHAVLVVRELLTTKTTTSKTL